MFSSKDVFFGSQSVGGYQISRSLRFRSSASAYLSRTFGTPTNGQKGTLSFWLKRGTIGTDQEFMGAGTSAYDQFQITSDQIRLVCNAGTDGNLKTTSVFRDPSAWYHVVLSIDTTNATAANRAIIYVNNVSQPLTTTTSVTLNSTPKLLSNVIHYVGCYAGGTTTNNLDGYLAEVNFIDGQALTPSSFGENNATTGVWGPKAYTGTYGTNGFYLKFADNSGATATAIGKDSSGNGNNWTPNNISVTAGVTYDSMIDTPTPYDDGTVYGVGNYCVLNPLNNDSTNTLSAANLNYSIAANAAGYPTSTFQFSSGKWYWECTVSSTHNNIGILLGATSPTTGLFSTGYGYYAVTGNKYVNGTGSAYGSTFTTNDVIGVAVDLDSGTPTITFYKNNVSQGAITIAAGTYKVGGGNGNSAAVASGSYNFGQRPFTYTPPSGFKALNTQNLPTPTIAAGNKYMDISLWTGDQNSRTITNSGAFQPDLIWTKSRSDAESHRLHDAVRGGNGTVLYELNSNTTEADGTDTLVSGFASNGFTIAAGANSPNITNRTYVAWQWKGGNGTTNIAVNAYGSTPSIASTVSANQSAGFSVVTYQIPTSGTSFTIGHGLGVAPSMIIQKTRSTTSNWQVYHSSLGATNGIWLNLTNASGAQSWWNNTAPTSTLFSINNSLQGASAVDTVAYCFAAVSGYSAFGSYIGNNSDDGPFIYLGFRPKFFMVKDAGTAGAWVMIDATRSAYNVASNYLFPNTSAAEASSPPQADFLANGIKLRANNANSGQNNVAGNTYIYAAFAENPLKYSLAR